MSRFPMPEGGAARWCHELVCDPATHEPPPPGYHPPILEFRWVAHDWQAAIVAGYEICAVCRMIREQASERDGAGEGGAGR